MSRALSHERKVNPTILAVLGTILLSQSVVADTLPTCTKSEREAYFDAIESKIHENWRVPLRNRSLSCKVLVKQDWRGEVRDVGIALCGTDIAVQRSIINATYRASPMPMPDNKLCFTESVIVTIEIRTQASD